MMTKVVSRWEVGSGGKIAEASLITMESEEAKLHARKGVPILELTDVYCHPSVRRKGLAGSCVTSALEYADTHGVDLFLRAINYGKESTAKAAKPRMATAELIDWYMRLGFKPYARTPQELVRRFRA